MTFIFVFMHGDKAKYVYRKWNVAYFHAVLIKGKYTHKFFYVLN